MISWNNDYEGHVGKLIRVIIHQRADGMHDVELVMIGGDLRQLCNSLRDAHDIAELLCASEFPDNDL